MIYRRLGRTELRISVLSIGGGALNIRRNPHLSLTRAKKAISFAIERGMNLIDVAKNYDEKFISKVLGRNKKKIYISARSDAPNGESITKDIKDSIKNFRIRPITIYQASQTGNGIIDALESAKKAGLINHIGIFSHKIKLLKKAVQTGRYDVVVVMYNTVHRMAEQLFKYTHKYDVGVLVIAPLASGILIHPNCERGCRKKMTSQKALRFVLSNKNVTSCIIGTHNISHIEENIRAVESERKAIEWGISTNERNKLVKEAEVLLGKKFCRMCRYCECPRGIQIADILKSLIISEIYAASDQAKEEYLQQNVKFNACNLCGECEKKCPYHLPIIEMLKMADKVLS